MQRRRQPRPSSRQVVGVVDVALIGVDGPAVVISAETAYWLEKLCKVSLLRQRLRDGRHPQVSNELLDLRRGAMTFDPARLSLAAQVESGLTKADSQLDQGLLSVAEVADLLDLTGAAVRLACREGRLEAEQVGRRWQITREACANFRAARAA